MKSTPILPSETAFAKPRKPRDAAPCRHAILVLMKKQEAVDVSPFSAELLNVALDMSLEWGKNWFAPIQDRIREAYPELSPEDADILDSWCIEAREYAYALVEEEYPMALRNEKGTAMDRVQQKYPQIDKKNLSHLYSQGMYYAWHG